MRNLGFTQKIEILFILKNKVISKQNNQFITHHFNSKQFNLKQIISKQQWSQKTQYVQ
jgi:hypothetical protein